MLASKYTTSSHFLPRQFRPFLFASPCRHASVQAGDYAVPTTPAQRVYNRYRIKLENRARTLGMTDIGELRQAHKPQIAELKRQDQLRMAPPRDTPSHLSKDLMHRHGNMPAPFTPPAAPPVPPAEGKIKTLAAYLDLDKTRALGPKEIEAVWRLRNAHLPNSLCAAIPAATFQHMADTARVHPRFVLPLPKEPAVKEEDIPENEEDLGTATMHFVEWGFPTPTVVTAIITHLDEFKNKGEFAIPHTVVTHHLDLIDEKGVVLLQGVVTDHCGMGVTDARWLLAMLQKFYGGVAASTKAQEIQGLLENFSQGSEAFDIRELLEVAETVG